MNKKNIMEELKKFLNNKHIVNIIIVLLVIAFLWLALDAFIGIGSIFGKSSDTLKGAEEVLAEEALSKEILNYEEKQEKELSEILAKMDGVGDVEVMMYFESGEVKVPAVDESTQTSTTKEDDSQGGTRLTEQETNGSNIVMGNNGGGNEPFILQTYKPPVTGVYIVAEGAENTKIKYDIQVAVSTLYDVSLDKINVYPMKK